MRFKTIATLALMIALPLSGMTADPKPAEGEAVIEIKNYKFIPDELTVKVGTTVRWVNMEKRQYHNIYFESLGDTPSDYFFPDETRERTFDKPGTYPYICEPHDASHQMRGVIHVVE